MSGQIDKLRKASMAVYLATEKDIADDISSILRAAADRIAELEADNQRLREAAQAVVDSATPHYDRWVNGVTRICINRLAALLGGGENG